MFRLTLEKTLNHLINTNNIDTEGLNNKIIGLSVDEFNLRLLFMFANSRVFVMRMHDQGNFDVDIKLNKTAFLYLFKGASFEELIESDEIDINGSVKTAQQLADLIALASIDVEELVSHYTGDIIAHQLGKSVKLVKGKANKDKVNIVEALKNDLTTLLVAPSRSRFFNNNTH
ncbi:SCP2 sterol-binding domain-containing protein [Candidatus Thioglobus sp.]|nr:SCP2 sterol-binding domain-containing protein [Candidatus Thioglobus sp.]